MKIGIIVFAVSMLGANALPVGTFSHLHPTFSSSQVMRFAVGIASVARELGSAWKRAAVAEPVRYSTFCLVRFQKVLT
jgi:hypothetical protein